MTAELKRHSDEESVPFKLLNVSGQDGTDLRRDFSHGKQSLADAISGVYISA
jgi:hypothetical protein